MEFALGFDDYAAIDSKLADTDRLLRFSYPGDNGGRQPVHTVYVPADRYQPSLPGDWGREAIAAVERAGGMGALCSVLGVNDDVGSLVSAKLTSEPIEDLRLDFADGPSNFRYLL